MDWQSYTSFSSASDTATSTQEANQITPRLERHLAALDTDAKRQRLLGKLNTVPSRTPALGQRWVMVLRLV